MDAAKPTTELIDLIYRDPNRLPSLSAQLFGGHLLSSESGTGERKGSEKSVSGGLNIAVAKADGIGKWQSEQSESTKQTRAPHDLTASDVINGLIDRKALFGGYSSAPNSSVIRAVGTLFLFDPTSMLRMFGPLFSAMTQGGEAGQALNPIGAIMAGLILPPMFILVDSSGKICCGTVLDAGLADPIATFIAKHGDMGLPDVKLVGIKEVAIAQEIEGVSPFLDAARNSNKELTKLIFPEKGTRVSPICIYRTLAE